MKKQFLFLLGCLFVGLSGNAALPTKQYDGINYAYTSNQVYGDDGSILQSTNIAYVHSVYDLNALPTYVQLRDVVTDGEETYPVTTILSTAFQNNTKVNFITMGEFVTTLTPSCFSGCTNLQGVLLSNNIYRIPSNAFDGCNNLTMVNIPTMATSIMDNAFHNCASLAEIVIPSNVREIGSKAFELCTSLSEITFLGTTPPSISSDAFNGVDKANLTINVPAGAKADFAAALAQYGITGSQINDGSIIVTISANTGHSWKNTGQTANGTWSSQWRSTATEGVPQVRISSGLGAGAFFLWQNNGVLDIRSAQNTNTRWDVTVMDPNYYISEISFVATRTTANACTAYVNGIAIDGQKHTFTYNENELPALIINRGNGTSNNSEISWTDFTVTLLPRTHKPVVPTEEGWYVIQSTQDFLDNFYGYTAGLNPSGTYEHTNGDYDLTWQQFNGKIDEISPDNFIYITPADATHFKAQLSNGNYLHNACMSLRDESTVQYANLTSSNRLYELPAGFNEMRLGSYWYAFSTTDSKVGQGSSGSGYSCRMFKVNPESRFDVWTVNMVHVEYGDSWYADVNNVHIPHLASDPKLTITSADVNGFKSDDNRKSVYNGGKFFMTKGVVPQFSQLKADQNGINNNPEITIDSDTKTITVDYSKVHGDKTLALSIYNANKQAALAAINPYKGVLSDEEYVAFTSDIEAISVVDEDTKEDVENKNAQLLDIDLGAKVSAIKDKINGRLVHIKSLNRTDSPYLTLTGTSVGAASANTVATPEERSVWMLWKHTDNIFYLFSPTLNCFLNYNGGNVNMSQGGGASRFTLAMHDVTDGAVKICDNAATTHYLAATTGNGNATLPDAATDAATAWTVELASVPASQISTDKIYTLRSSYSVHTQGGSDCRANGTLLGASSNLLESLTSESVAYTAASTNETIIHHSNSDGINQLWRIHDNGDGTYSVRNIANEFGAKYGALDLTATGSKANASNTVLTISPATSIAGYSGGDPSAVVFVAEDGSYVSSNGNSAEFTDVDSGSSNNAASSCVYYLHEVADAQSKINAYISAAVTGMATYKAGATSMINNYVTYAPALWTSEDAESAIAATAAIEIPDSYDNIQDANAGILTLYAPYYTFYMTAAGKDVQFRNKQHTNYYMAYDGTNDYASSVQDATNLGSIWKVVADNENHGFKLQNYLTGTQCSNTNSSANNVNMNFAADGHTFDFEINTVSETTGLLIRARDNYSNRYYYHMASSASYSMVKWTNTLASMFTVALADDLASEEVKVEAKYEDNVHHLIFSHATGALSKHPTYHASHAVTLVKQEAVALLDDETDVEPDVVIAHADIVADGDNLKVNLNQKLDAGEYAVIAPMGYFKVGSDKLSAPITASIGIGEDGQVATSISEISDADKADVAVYDLQGRRLNEPRKGSINIINGKKIFVY